MSDECPTCGRPYEDAEDGMEPVQPWVARGDVRPPQDYVARYHEARERQRQQRAREHNGDPER
jgi:hypothetical protein